MKRLLSEEDHYARLARKRVSASVLVFHRGKLLIVQPTYEPHALLPGGSVDELETPKVAALRECREELGFDVELERFLGVDHTLYPEKHRGDCLHFMFLAKELGDDQASSIRLPKEELSGYEFLVPNEAAGRLGRRIKLRMEAGIRAIANGSTFYTENGREI